MLTRLGFPQVGRHRPFVSALAIDALGSGIWMPLSLLYFLRQTDLTLVQLGVAMTVANLVVMPLVPVVGGLVDRLGPKRVMQAGNLLQAASFAVYPFAHSLVAVGVVVGVSTFGRTMFWGSNGPMVTQIAPPGERELWFGFVQALRNAGYGVGGLLASIALTVDTDAAYTAVVLANAASYLLAFALMTGVEGGERPGRPRGGRPTVGLGRVLADRGYRWLVAAIFLYALTEMTLNVTMPVYAADLLGLDGVGARCDLRDQHRDDRTRPGARRAVDDGGDPLPGGAGRDRLHRVVVRADVRRRRGERAAGDRGRARGRRRVHRG